MRCYCVETDETFDFCIEGAHANAIAAIEAAWFKLEGQRYIKRYPAGIEDRDILARNFARLGPAMFGPQGSWEAALAAFAHICDAHAVRWAITGSLSETLMGVAIQPHDLDIVIHTDDFFRVKQVFLDQMVEPFVDNGGNWVVRYFGRICLYGRMIDIVADPTRNMDQHDYWPVSWRGYEIKVEPLLDRLIVELHRNRRDRIIAFDQYLELQPGLNVEKGVLESIRYLQSDAALKSVGLDPYWPKWDSPWWHMSLLFEMGLSDLIPDTLVSHMILCMNDHYLKFFPIYEDEVPEGIDYYTKIPCHCQLGNMYQILRSRRPDLDTHMPWIRPWFLKYQLPDGGLNCEDDAYRESHKSSIASSLPVFEAVMMIAETVPLSDAESAFLNRAVQYLVDHRLVYKKTGDQQLMDEDFLRLQFPRFYSYDILRGLSLLARWYPVYRDKETGLAQKVLTVMEEALQTLSSLAVEGHLMTMRSDLFKGTTRTPDPSGAFSKVAPKSTFTLLRAVGTVGIQSPYLTWYYKTAQEALF